MDEAMEKRQETKTQYITESDKRILETGTLEEQSGLLLDHFHDKTDVWVVEARLYFRKFHKEVFRE